MRFSILCSLTVMVLPFVGAAPLGLLDNVKPGELITFRKMTPFETCGIIGPCFCDDSGCYEPFNGAKGEETPNLPVGKPEIKPICTKAPCMFGGDFPFNQTEDASAKNGDGTADKPKIKPVCAKEPCDFKGNFPFNRTEDGSSGQS